MEQFLREWRHEALNKHQYKSAIFAGDKLLAITKSQEDAFWLAQVHFSAGNYTHAQSFLSQLDLISDNPSCKYLAAHCLVKQEKYEEALALLGDKNPTHLIGLVRQSADPARAAFSKASRSLTRRTKTGQVEAPGDQVDPADIRFEAGMCYLRGLCYSKQSAYEKAKRCYMDAVRIDPKCYEAFDQLTKNSLMTSAEEWEFISSLGFTSLANTTSDHSAIPEAADFTKMLYLTRVSKYEHPEEFVHAKEVLSSQYNLQDTPGLLLAEAELLFSQCRFKQALELTQKIVEIDQYDFDAMPLHLACLYELKQKNTLYLLAHDLADNRPLEPVTWLAVGIYYMVVDRVSDARGFFSKASIMDPYLGPAWIGFAHTFAAEGEHDQAISAYSTAARLFQGSHLPQLYLGMQHIQLNNFALAHKYLDVAYTSCQTDPLVLNELGVLFYNWNQLSDAIQHFTMALEIGLQLTGDPRQWVSTQANLGHALRRAGRFHEALEQFDEVIRNGGGDAAMFSAKGLVLLELQQVMEAIVAFHEALAINSQDAIATTLLTKALSMNEVDNDMFLKEEISFEETILEQKRKLGLVKTVPGATGGKGHGRGKQTVPVTVR